MEPKQSPSKKKTSKKKTKKSPAVETKVEPVIVTPEVKGWDKEAESKHGHLVEELNKVSPGYILQLFDNTKCPAKLAYDVKMLEKHCYELAMKLFYFYDMNDLGFRALVLDTKALLDSAVARRVEIYRESGN